MRVSKRIPHSVIGSTSDFGSEGSGSSPDGEVTKCAILHKNERKED